MNARLLNQTELPLLLHLCALALWTGGAFASTFLAAAMKRERDWRLRAVLLRVSGRVVAWAQLPGAALGIGSGLWLVLSEHLYGAGSAPRLPIPVWLWIKIGVVALAVVATATAFLSLRKASAAAVSSITDPTAAREDRFDAHRRGVSAAGWTLLLCLLAVLVLSGVRPNW